MSANNSYAERNKQIRARTMAAWHLQNTSPPEFSGVEYMSSELTTRRLGQLNYYYQGATNPVQELLACGCGDTSLTVEPCNTVGTVDNIIIDGDVDFSGGLYTINFSWDPVINATSYSLSSNQPDAVFTSTGATSASLVTAWTEGSEIEWTITASNDCSSSSGSSSWYCFLAGSLVRMADGTNKVIEDVAVGDLILGAFGEINAVLGLHRSKLGLRKMLNINGDHKTTPNHPHISIDKKFYAANISALENNTYGRMHTVIDANGNKVQMMLHGLNKGRVQALEIGAVLQHIDGSKVVESLEYETMSPDTDLYNLVVGGSHTYYVDGYAVTGWPREDDFDYDNWVPK